MGRNFTKLKPFITESIFKGYINFKRLENGFLELYTPNYRKNFDHAYEKIFKDYEEYNDRKYKGYKCKDNLRSAIKKSKYFEFKYYQEKRFVFRERSILEIESMKKKEHKVLDASPDSGYASGEPSPFATKYPEDPKSLDDNEDFPEDIDFGYINMDELKNLELTDETFKMMLHTLYSDGCSFDELNQYLNSENEFTEDIEWLLGLLEGTSEDHVLRHSTPDGKNLSILTPEKN